MLFFSLTPLLKKRRREGGQMSPNSFNVTSFLIVQVAASYPPLFVIKGKASRVTHSSDQEEEGLGHSATFLQPSQVGTFLHKGRGKEAFFPVKETFETSRKQTPNWNKPAWIATVG